MNGVIKKTYFQIYTVLLFTFMSVISPIVIYRECVNEGFKMTANDWPIVKTIYLGSAILILTGLLIYAFSQAMKFTIRTIITLIILAMLTPIDILGSLVFSFPQNAKYSNYLIAIVITGFVIIGILTIINFRTRMRSQGNENNLIEKEVDKL